MGKIDDRIARRPEASLVEVTALTLLTALMRAVDDSGLSRRAIARDARVSSAALTLWARHDSWPSLLPLAQVAEQVGLRLAWQRRQGLAATGLGADGSRQLPIEGVSAPPDGAVRGWWPGGVPEATFERSAMRIGAEIAWRRVHILRWEVAECARAAEMDSLTWRRVECGMTRTGQIFSSPGLDKVVAAALVVAWEPWPGMGTVHLGWRSVDAPLPLAPWQGASEAERDNLMLRHRRPGRATADG